MASPPSSTISCGPLPPGKVSAWSVHHQYSSSDLALPGEDRNAGRGDGGRRMVLRGEDVAACPAHVRAEVDQRLDQHGGLNGHVQRAGDADAVRAACSAAYLRRIDIRPGISCSAMEISLRPQCGQGHVGDFVRQGRGFGQNSSSFSVTSDSLIIPLISTNHDILMISFFE